MEELKPINTFYNGYYFRSRLEARWAVFFDEMDIHYEYEHEGYNLNGVSYLPDFWLPTFNGGCYVEVKPTELNKSEIKKAELLVMASRKPIILAVGTPNYKCQEVILFDECNAVRGLYSLHGLINALKANNRIYFSPGFENDDLTIPEDQHIQLGDKFINAIKKARYARF